MSENTNELRSEQGARILIVEPEAHVAMNLRDLLAQLGYQIAGTAVSADEAFSKMSEVRPDLLLVDVALRAGEDGIAAAQRIRRMVDLPIVFLAGDADSTDYVDRNCSKRELHSAVEFAFYRHHQETRLRKMTESVLEAFNYVSKPVLMADEHGNLVFLNRAAREIVERAGVQPNLIAGEVAESTGKRRFPKGMDALTPRELEVLNCFLRGLGTSTIGVRLRVSAQTVRNHLKNVCRKLAVRSQVELRELFADDFYVE